MASHKFLMDVALSENYIQREWVKEYGEALSPVLLLRVNFRKEKPSARVKLYSQMLCSKLKDFIEN